MTQKRLFRSRSERRIAGVCGGIAENAGVDPVFIRLAAVGLTLVAPPVGLVGYLACWIIIPEREAETAAGAIYEPPGQAEAPSPGASAAPASRRDSIDGSLVGGAIFVGIGLFFLLMNLGVLDWEMFRFWRWRFVWPMVVIVLGVLMLVRGVRGRSQWMPR